MSSAFFADDPIASADQDSLGRLAFSRQVAKLCDEVSSHSDSSVMALIGAWGSGKSSVLSLVAAELEGSDVPWEVVKFNPWLLSDIDSLVIGFFQSLSSALPSRGRLKTAKRKLGEYASLLAPFGKLGGIAGLDLGSVLDAIGTLASGGSIEKRRDELATALRGLNRTILIVMDDLDRLQPSELLLVFKLIRLVGRLPRVHYLLAYDERTILDLLMHSDLADKREDRAQSYLEKIVQVRLDLPPLHSEQVADLFDAGIVGILTRYELTISRDDQYRLSEAYQSCMINYLSNPRTINRFLAQIHAFYPLVHTEVNFVDFLLMTFLRTFAPTVYQRIPVYRDTLTEDQTPSTPQSVDGWRSFLGIDDNARGLLALLSHLFLPIQSTLHQVGYDSRFYVQLAQHQRVGHMDYFDRYLQFGVVGSDIADATVTRALHQFEAGGNDLNALTERLVGDASPVLRKLRTQLDRGTVPAPDKLILYLGEHYEPVRDRGRQQFVSLDDRAVVDIAVAAARLLPQGGLVTIAEALLADQRLSFVVEFAKVYAEEKGSALPEDVSDRLLDALRKHFQKLGEQPVRNMSQGDRRLLYRWQRLAGNAAPVREQLWRNVQDGWSLPQLLGALVPEATTWLGGNGNRQVIDEADPAQWDDLLDLRRVIAELGDLVDQAEEHIPDVDELEPTPQLRERYALSVVKRFKQQPTDA